MTKPRGKNATPDSPTDARVETSEAGNRTQAENAIPSADSVAARAFRRFEERGGEHGHDVEDWLEAERELANEGPE